MSTSRYIPLSHLFCYLGLHQVSHLYSIILSGSSPELKIKESRVLCSMSTSKYIPLSHLFCYLGLHQVSHLYSIILSGSSPELKIKESRVLCSMSISRNIPLSHLCWSHLGFVAFFSIDWLEYFCNFRRKKW